MNLIIYADGACSNNGMPNPVAGAGFIVLTETEEHRVRLTHKQIEERCTGYKVSNNTAELLALIFALEYVERLFPGAQDIMAYTDSNYVIGQLSGNRTNANGNLVFLLKDLVVRGSVRVAHCAGHSGVTLQECVDTLAVEGKTNPSETWVLPLSTAALEILTTPG
jgi:ribonuclease HI